MQKMSLKMVGEYGPRLSSVFLLEKVFENAMTTHKTAYHDFFQASAFSRNYSIVMTESGTSHDFDDEDDDDDEEDDVTDG